MVEGRAEVLSISDAAHRAGMTYERMRSEVIRGRVTGFRVAGKWRVDMRARSLITARSVNRAEHERGTRA